MVCVNDPQFNDIAREIFFNSAWEAWLSDHLVKSMVNYPDAVLLGKPSERTAISDVATCIKRLSLSHFRHWIKHWTSQLDCGRHGKRSCGAGRGLLQLREELQSNFFCQNHFYPLYVKFKNLDISTFGTLTASFSPDLNEPQDDKQGEGEDPVQLHQ